MERLSRNTLRRWTRPLLGYLAIVTAMALFSSTLVRTPTAKAMAGAQASQEVVQVPQTTFPGTGAGPIPDGLSGTPPMYGPPLVLSYAVSGITAPVTSVSVDVTLTHSWVGDLDMVLAAPGGS